MFALYIEKRSIKNLNNKFSFKCISPRIISYIIGMALILSISINPLILQEFRLATSMDVLIYSILSITGILIWAWRYRDIFIDNNDKLIIGTEDQSLQYYEHEVATARQYMSKYTIVLAILGTLSLIILSLIVASYFNQQDNGDIDSNLNILFVSLYTVLTVGCFTVVFLRKKKSTYTVFATRAISCFLIFWVPLGTATFIYWVWKVRKREEAVSQFYVALNEMFKGNVEPIKEVWSHTDDVAYMGPTGGIKIG